MAKWGEGDARWIVEERKDGVNVNGWHWEEKDRMAWTREAVPAMLNDVVADVAPLNGALRVRGVKQITGDACVTQRKAGKLFAVYDLVLEVEWEGSVEGDTKSKSVTGVLKISDFHSDSDEDDWMVECTTSSTSKHAEQLRSMALQRLKPLVFSRLEPYPAMLVSTFTMAGSATAQSGS